MASAVAPRPVKWLAGPLLIGWTVIFSVHALSADVLMLPVLLLTIALYLDAGTTMLDRFMFAGITLICALIVGGLLFSVWPWALSPLPISLALVTSVIMLGWVSRRRPQLPMRFDHGDAVVLGLGAFLAFIVIRPVLKAGPYVMSTLFEDRYAHFAIFDTVQRVGGYPFFHQAEAQTTIIHPTEQVYPAGSHLFYAIIDNFLRSSSGPVDTTAGFTNYFYLTTATYALLAVITVWAARWLLDGLTGWRLFAGLSVSAAVLASGLLTPTFTNSYDSLIFTMVLVAALVAVVARPPKDLGAQALLLVLIVVAITVSYYLMAAVAIAGLLAFLVTNQRSIRENWLRFAIAAVCTSALLAVPLYIAATGDLAIGRQTRVQGMQEFNGFLIAAVGLGLVAAWFSGSVRRLPQLRAGGLMFACLAIATAAFGIYLHLTTGGLGYYFGKLLVALTVIALCLLPFGAMVLRPLHGHRALDFGAGFAATAIAFSMFAGFQYGVVPTSFPGHHWVQSPAGQWYAGSYRSSIAASLTNLEQRGLLKSTVPTLVLTEASYLDNWRMSFFLAALNRDLSYATAKPVEHLQNMRTHYADLTPEQASKAKMQVLDELTLTARELHRPIRIVVESEALAQAITNRMRLHPELGVEVVLVPPATGRGKSGPLIW